jgi:hypothetical protein
VLAILCALAIAPATADAGVAVLVLDPGDERASPTEAFVYTAAAGEANNVVLADVGPAQETVRISDSAGVTLGRGCRRAEPADATVALCTSPQGAEIFDQIARLGDMNDTGTGPAMDGGPGDDRLTGRDLVGGPGNDTLRVASETGGALKGGPGDDDMTGSDGPYDTFDESDAANGSDVIRGGRGGDDSVSYRGRREAVHGDLDGDRDDGEVGEKDQIGADVENIEGGAGADTLVGDQRANRLAGEGGTDQIAGAGGADLLDANGIGLYGTRGPKTKDRLDGGAGDDVLLGSAGDNTLLPGPGQDAASGLGGRDRIRARDGAVDEIRCGSGRDATSVDGLDFVAGGCESLRRRGAAGAVPLAMWDAGSSSDVQILYVGCPADGPKMCRGAAAFSVKGKLRGRKKFAIRRGRMGSVLFSTSRRGSYSVQEGQKVTLAVRSRTRRGRLRRISTRRLVIGSGGLPPLAG